MLKKISFLKYQRFFILFLILFKYIILYQLRVLIYIHLKKFDVISVRFDFSIFIN